METTPTEEAEGQAIVQVLAVVLERLVSANSHLAQSSQEQTHFHAQRAPAIGVLQYLERNNFLLTELNVHRVVITAVLLAAKFFDDAYYNNAYYAKVGGVLVEEMNNLECQFLFKIDFSLRVVPEVFEKYNDELISHSSAMGLARISKCTDEELFCAPRLQVDGGEACRPVVGAPHPLFQGVAPQPQAAPMLQTYSQGGEVDYNPVVAYPNPVEGSAASHYPIQALHQPIPQVTQQQQTSALTIDPVYPFPALAPQVSAQQQAQAPPSQNPIELDLIYHTNTTTPAAAAVAPQDASFSQYNNPNQLHHGLVTAPQAQVYTQSELEQKYQAAAPSNYPLPAQAPVYSQHTNYFNTNGTVQATSHQPMLPNHSEITPSPPPQPPINMHGPPTAYHNGEVGCAAVNLASMAYLHHNATHPYPTPANAALDLHHQPQLLPSRPIAIGGQDNHRGWSYNMVSLPRGASASDPT